jgi:transposase
MYVETSHSRGKYTRHLLRESFREGAKVKHRTIANLSRCTPQEIEAMRLALKHKGDLTALGSVGSDIGLRQGVSVWAVWAVYDLARQLGVAEALGCSREGRLALWQVIARVIDQGSRLSAVRLGMSHAACEVVGLEGFNEDDLYGNLDWLEQKQGGIEERLFTGRGSKGRSQLFLYDVTSSYLEGRYNELGEFGYNRDGKKGKQQIVVGLLCDEGGRPVLIQVFPGNTSDGQTLGDQIRKVAERFGGKAVTFVGDRGMIKSDQIASLGGQGFHYITAITKPQIEALLKQGTIQMGLFDEKLSEVTEEDGTRYILRRNPLRVEELEKNRQSKQNAYLQEHAGAKPQVALRKVVERSEKLKLTCWVTASLQGREIRLAIDEAALQEARKLDGCYVLKTDAKKSEASKETIHDRYKDLALVEWAFRTSKTVALEMRPVYVRRERRTRGHALVVMLAYLIVQELGKRWYAIDMTVEEGIKELTSLCATEIVVKGKARCNKIPEPRPSVANLLKQAKVVLPQALPCRTVMVATRRKLTQNRKRK